ncbi:hypothetical protein CEXT_667841 [Caerostris extrusa]|uniref:Uncharacterized protein n=1 Tax=Caerostris extrusa TaxID=172846 RepID=A0AAV4SK40_CAEEX|nr:hypothetical protein CEXT_667841 [Caerostris extrusa]
MKCGHKVHTPTIKRTSWLQYSFLHKNPQQESSPASISRNIQSQCIFIIKNSILFSSGVAANVTAKTSGSHHNGLLTYTLRLYKRVAATATAKRLLDRISDCSRITTDCLPILYDCINAPQYRLLTLPQKITSKYISIYKNAVMDPWILMDFWSGPSLWLSYLMDETHFQLNLRQEYPISGNFWPPRKKFLKTDSKNIYFAFMSPAFSQFENRKSESLTPNKTPFPKSEKPVRSSQTGKDARQKISVEIDSAVNKRTPAN